MSVIDSLVRVDAICKKFEKYDVSQQKELANVSPDDHFMQLYTTMQADIEALMKKANDVLEEKNRAVVAATNAEIRRTKVNLLQEIPKLERLALKKVKKVPPEELATRPDLVIGIKAKIEDIAEGTTMGPRKKKRPDTSHIEIKIDPSSAEEAFEFNAGKYQHTAESSEFQEEFEMRKRKQDENLDVISEGLSTLKNMAEDIGEELDKQDPLVNEMEDKIDKAAKDITKNNKRMMEVLTKVRSGRNFCIDIICLCVVLGIAAYLYKALKK